LPIPWQCSTWAAAPALLRTLAERLPGERVTLCGVDPAPAMLEVARASLGADRRVTLALATAEHLPFHEAIFDLVVSMVSFDGLLAP
jgi:ubiquinone/menaquinone biosynthesis C-methylase UbiE